MRMTQRIVLIAIGVAATVVVLALPAARAAQSHRLPAAADRGITPGSNWQKP